MFRYAQYFNGANEVISLKRFVNLRKEEIRLLLSAFIRFYFQHFVILHTMHHQIGICRERQLFHSRVGSQVRVFQPDCFVYRAEYGLLLCARRRFLRSGVGRANAV